MENPLVSIITVCKNSEKTISESIKSVAEQTYKNIQYIVLDGGSTDTTVDKIRKNLNKIDVFLSKEDKGMYFALNEGLKLAEGDIIGTLHADDVYTHKDVIKNIVEEFRTKEIDATYGDVMYVDKKGKQVREYVSPENAEQGFKKTIQPAHPTFFAKKKVYNEFGGFDTSIVLASDYELLLRLLVKEKIKYSYIPKTLIYMQDGGLSNKNLKNILKNNLEVYRISKRYNLDVTPITVVKKLYSKYRSIKR